MPSWTTPRANYLQCEYLCKFKINSADCGSTKRNQTESPLFCLPGELRNKVYELIFDGATLRFDPEGDESLWAVAHNPGLHQTCVQLRHETQAYISSPPTVRLLDDLLLFEVSEDQAAKGFPFGTTLEIKRTILLTI